MQCFSLLLPDLIPVGFDMLRVTDRVLSIDKVACDAIVSIKRIKHITYI